MPGLDRVEVGVAVVDLLEADESGSIGVYPKFLLCGV